MAIRSTGGFALLRHEPGNPEFPTLPDGVKVPHVTVYGGGAGLAARAPVRTGRRIFSVAPNDDEQRFAGWQTQTTWVNPTIIDFGVIPSPVQRTVSLYNARSEAITVTALSLPSGVTLLDGLPVTLFPYAGYTFTVEAATTGDNEFDEFVEFTTSVGAVPVRMIGRRVFSLNVLPEVPLRETMLWKTDLLRSTDGTEKAYSLMYTPNIEVDYKVKFRDDIQRIRFRNQFIAGESALVVAGQKWYEMRPLRESVAAPATTLTVEGFQSASWAAGDPISVVSVDTETVAGAQVTSVTVGPDPDVESNVLLLRFDGADGSTSTEDLSPLAHEVEFRGTSAISTTQSKFGGSSLKCGGSFSNSVFVEWNTQDTLLGGEDFTIECWTYLTPTDITNLFTNVCLLGNYISTIGSVWNLRLNQTALHFQCLQPGFTNFYFGVGSPSWQANQWYHIRVTRNGNNLRAFVDGVQIGATEAMTGAMPTIAPTSPMMLLSIGAVNSSGFTYPHNGYIDDVRITKGLARSTVDFTPPTESFASVDDTYTEINLASEIGEAFSAGAYILPVGIGYVSRFPTYSTHQKNLEEADYTLTFNQESDFAELPTNFVPTLTDLQSPENVLPILEFRNEIEGGRTKKGQVQRREDVLESGLSNRQAYSWFPYADEVGVFQITLTSFDEIWNWRKFLHYLRGSYNEFYIPTYTNDIPNVTTTASNVFNVEDIDLSLLFGNPPDPRRNAIRLEFPDGTVEYRMITQVIDNVTTEEITVSSAVTAGNPEISFLQRARIFGDTVSWEHVRNDYAQLRFAYRTILR